MSTRGPSTSVLDENLRGLTKVVIELRTEMKLMKWLGVFVAGLLVAVVVGAGRVVWDAAPLTSEARQQGIRLEKVEGRLDGVERRLDGIDGKLDTLIRRAEPKAAGRPPPRPRDRS